MTVGAEIASAWPADLVALYGAERTGLVRAAYLICGSFAAAEDAVHDAVTRVAARWDSVDDGRSYLYVAAVNAARDAARRNTRHTQLFTGGKAVAVGDDHANLSLESMALRDALMKLPEAHRTAVVLRYFADWDDAEIAQRLKVRPATVRSWVHRGITRMRREMER